MDNENTISQIEDEMPTSDIEYAIDDPQEDAVLLKEGETYWRDNDWTSAIEIFDFNLGTKLVSGQDIPIEPKTGDIFISNNIMYIYNAVIGENEDGYISYLKKEDLNGWSAKCLINDSKKETCDIAFLNEISTKPVVSICYGFYGCKLSKSDVNVFIPANVTDIRNMMEFCEINSNVTFNIDGNPNQYENCLIFKNPKFGVSDKGLIRYSDFTFTVIGNCDLETKNKIAETIIDDDPKVNIDMDIIIQ